MKTRPKAEGNANDSPVRKEIWWINTSRKGKTMRILLIFTLAVWIYAATATAQIAAPRLDTNVPESLETLNPATMAFSGPSRLGVGLGLDFTIENTTGGVTTTVAEGDAQFIGWGRFVGEFFSIGVESISIDFTVPSSTFTAELNTTYVGGSFLIGDFLSIGFGQQDSEFISSNSIAGFTQTEEESLPMVGVSLRFGEAFYAGVVSGTETITDTTEFLGVTTVDEGERTVTRLGVAYHFRDDNSGFHLEFSTETKDGINDTSTGFTVDEEENTTIMVEAVFSNILIGVEKISGEDFDPSTGVVNLESEITIFTLGWVPMEGFSISVSVSTEEDTDPSTGDIETTESTFVGASWLF